MSKHNTAVNIQCNHKYLLSNVTDGVVPGSRTTDTEVMDVLYRVQGGRLNDAPRPRNLIGGGGE